jgi:peptidoglycan/xylan/chitin deacetylase (PgdA/CDA1 family)
MLLVRKKPRRIVLFYHSVKSQDAEKFADQMACLVPSKYMVVKASEILLTSRDDGKSCIALTFDDAFVSVLNNAIPVLKDNHLTATIFVPTGCLGQSPRWEMAHNSPDRDETVMSSKDIAQLEKDGFEVLSHTVSHPDLTKISGTSLQDELKESKAKLEDIVGHEVCGICYPHGRHNTAVCETAKQVGYQYGFTVEPVAVDKSPDSMQIGRFSVSAQDSLMKFRLKASGAYEVVYPLRRIKRLIAGVLFDAQ